MPWWDLESAVDEVHRTAAAGAKAIAFSENPTVLGYPSVHTDHWDPLWNVVSEVGLPLCMHIGSSSRMATSSDDAPVAVAWTATGMNSLLAFADWLWSGIFDRFPAMRVVFSEGGAGWVPYALERSAKFLDAHASRNGSLRRPLDVYREHMFVCMVTDDTALSQIDVIGEDNLMWESDYPHTDGMWPHSRSTLERSLADIPDDIAVKIGSSNAQRVFAAVPPPVASGLGRGQ
jgi:predicted TIM-barrel fold metal-dependent hydrolase